MAIKIDFRIHTPRELSAGILGGTEDVSIILHDVDTAESELIQQWKELVAIYADLPESAIEVDVTALP